MIPAGRFFHATSELGLEPMSTAFLRQAGIVRLFSGVMKRIPLEFLMVSRKVVYSAGVGSVSYTHLTLPTNREV